jgi:3-oxoacyl-[acyl-carrier protein] reductase
MTTSNGNGNGRPEGAALVTGASGGIGAATARALAAGGWPVAVHFRSNPEGAAEVVAAIEDSGGRAVAVGADLDSAEAPDELLTQVEESFGTVLVLVNNAGRRADGLSPQIKDQEWQDVIETNLNAAFRLTRRTLKPMLRARFGRVVNVASVVGPRANPGQANYAASKAGLIGMTKTIAVEVARRGVTVNAVAPGLVETGLTADLPAGAFDQAIPARRPGTPDEIAACIGFLASDEASYVTGSVLTVDGGMSA